MRRHLVDLVHALEPRVLFAGLRSITDVDGDVFAISVIGAGDLQLQGSVSDVVGFIESLNVSGTDKNSQVRLNLTSQGAGGDGRINLRGLNVQSPVKSILMDRADLLGDGSAAIADVLTLRFGNIASGNSTFDIGKVEVLKGPRGTLFGNVGTGGAMTFTARQKTATFANYSGATLAFLAGIDKLKSNGDLRTTLSNGVGAGKEVREIDVVNALRASGIITGDVKTIKAGSLESAGGQYLDIDGFVGSLSSKSTFDARVRADAFGTIKTLDFGGQLEYRGVDAKGVSVGSFAATGQWDGGRIAIAAKENGGTGNQGLIKTFSSSTFVGGFIGAGGVGSFKVAGEALGLNVDLTGLADAIGLKSLTIGGQASGSLTVRDDAGPIRIGHSTLAAPFFLDDGGVNARFKSFSITDALSNSRVFIDIGSLESFNSAGGLEDSEIGLDAIVPSLLKTFKISGTLRDSEFDLAPSIGIGTFEAERVDACDFNVGYINSFKVKSTDFGLTGSSLLFTGQNTKGYALQSANFGKHFEMSGLSVMGPGKLGALTSGRYFGGEVTAPTIDSILATGSQYEAFGNMDVWATSNPLNGFSIKTIDIRGLATNSDIGAAGSIDKIRINCIHALSNAQKFRVSAGTVNTPASMPADLSGFAVGARINLIDIFHKFDAEDDYTSAFFLAPEIQSINVAGRINTSGLNDGGQPFGFGAATFGTIKLKDTLGGQISLVNPPLGATDPYPAETLSNFQVFRYQF